MDHICFHYTSRLGAQDIISTRVIQLGRTGAIWLTPTLYALGHEAANHLGIIGKPVDMVVEIPLAMIINPTSLSPVRAVVQPGQMIRQGLGWEFTVQHTINVAGLRWITLAWP